MNTMAIKPKYIWIQLKKLGCIKKPCAARKKEIENALLAVDVNFKQGHLYEKVSC
jgi:hypothetical protein